MLLFVLNCLEVLVLLATAEVTIAMAQTISGKKQQTEAMKNSSVTLPAVDKPARWWFAARNARSHGRLNETELEKNIGGGCAAVAY